MKFRCRESHRVRNGCSWLGHPCVCLSLWLILTICSAASIRHYLPARSWRVIPVFPDVVRQVAYAKFSPQVDEWIFQIWMVDGEYEFLKPDLLWHPPYSGEFYVGTVNERREQHGVFWSSLVKTDWTIEYQGSGSMNAVLAEAVFDRFESDTGIKTTPRKSTRLTRWVFADAAHLGLLGLSIASLILAFRQVVSKVRRRTFQCAKCGYDLTGLAVSICPECGATVAKSDQATA